MKYKFIATLFFLIVGCEDTATYRTPASDASRIIGSDTSTAAYPDIPVIESALPDAYIDPCLNITSTSMHFCECEPQCCQTQLWFCPPSGLGASAAEIVMNICNENLEVCDRSSDLTCPPNEILSQGSCNTILECPPNLDNDITITVQCEIEGVQGEQEILCRKGDIEYGECITCEPGEERCNFVDDDCDGQVDEGQRNVCDSCGAVPADICDGSDNDCDGLIDEDLVRECETTCERGLEICESGNWISCTATQPSDEACDGADNDCDGQIDEQLNCLCTVNDVGNLMPCTEPPLLCGQGFKTCECVDPECTEMRMTDCAAICSYIQMPEPPVCDPRRGISLEQEECNNFDEDCDQVVDEELLQACYTGSPDTLLVGVCTPGEVYCHQGVWGNHRPPNNQFEPGLCVGEITPQEEICNGADDDCDGIVDYGEEIRETDILFIVDWSGSMDDEIAAVKIALNRFATHFAAEEPLQWGLVIGPKEFEAGGDEYLLKVSDIAPFDQFLAAFAALGSEGMDTGNEMLLDAVYLAVQNISGAANVNIPETQWIGNTSSRPSKENFSITWRPNAERIVIVFSDEVEQSFLRYSDRSILGDPINKPVVEAAVRGGIRLKVYAFSSGGGFGNMPNHWEDIALAGNGSLFNLSSNAVSMYNDLMSIIDEACLPNELENEDQAYLLENWNRMSPPSSTPKSYNVSWEAKLMCY
jgi:hypothetical protein